MTPWVDPSNPLHFVCYVAVLDLIIMNGQRDQRTSLDVDAVELQRTRRRTCRGLYPGHECPVCLLRERELSYDFGTPSSGLSGIEETDWFESSEDSVRESSPLRVIEGFPIPEPRILYEGWSVFGVGQDINRDSG